MESQITSNLTVHSTAKINNRENMQVFITGPLWGESTGDRWIPLTKGQ